MGSLVEDLVKLLKLYYITKTSQDFEDVEILIDFAAGSVQHSSHNLTFMPTANSYEAWYIVVEQ